MKKIMFFAGLALFLFPSVSLAGKTTDPKLEQAKKLFAQGRALYLQKQYDACGAKFLEAAKYKDLAAFYYNAAVCYEKGGAYAKAIKYFSEYLKRKPKADDVADLAKRIQTLTKFLAARKQPGPARPGPARPGPARPGPARPGPARPGPARPGPARPGPARPGPARPGPARPGPARPGPARPGPARPGPARPGPARPGPAKPTEAKSPALPPIRPKAVVIIDSDPSGATVWIGDKMHPPVGKTPVEISLREGRHRVILETKGYRPVKRTIRIQAGKMADFFFSLSQDSYLGWVQVTANIPGANVYIDNRTVGAVGRTPYTGVQKPGLHTIWVGKRGYVTKRKDVTVKSGPPLQVHFTLERVRYGWVSIVGAPKGAKVSLDGLSLCRAPCKTLKVPAGGHVLKVAHKGRKPLRSVVKVEQGRLTVVKVRLTKAPSRIPAYVLYGVTGAILGGAVYAAVMAKRLRDDYQSDLDDGQLVTSQDSRLRKGKIFSIVADGLFGASLLMGGIALYYQFRNPGPKSRAAFVIRGVSLTPSFGLGTVALSGRF